jgi:hypothetical protein
MDPGSSPGGEQATREKQLVLRKTPVPTRSLNGDGLFRLWPKER